MQSHLFKVYISRTVYPLFEVYLYDGLRIQLTIPTPTSLTYILNPYS